MAQGRHLSKGPQAGGYSCWSCICQLSEQIDSAVSRLPRLPRPARHHQVAASGCSSRSLNTKPSMRSTDLENPYSMHPQLSPTLTEAMRSLTRLFALKRSCPGRAARGATVTTRMPGGVPSASASSDELNGCSLAFSS